jgi:transcriptional regulator PpsR
MGPAGAADLSALSALAPQLAQTFVSVASDIALVIDADGVIRNVAVGAEAPTSDAGGWVGRRWADTVTGDTRGKIEQLLSEVRSSGVTRRREVNHPSEGGTDVPVAYAAIRLGEGGPVLAVGRDLRVVAAIQQRFIDAQQEMERDYWKQRRAESRYRMLFQVATDAVMMVDAQTLKIVEANGAASALLGNSGTGVVGQVATIGFEPSSRAGVEELLNIARTTGRPAEIRARLARAAVDRADLPADGLAVDISATPFRADGAMLLLVRARVASATHLSSRDDERLAEFVAHTPDVVVITDSSGRVLMANPAFVSICRAHGEAQVIGRALADTLGDPSRQLANILAETRRLGIASRRRAHVGNGNTEPIEVEVSAALLAEGDQECVGLTMRRIGARSPQDSAPIDDLAGAIGRLAVRLGVVPLSTLVEQVGALAEQHLIQAALQRTGGNLALAAQLLRVSPEDLTGRMEHRGLPGPNGSNGSGNGGKPPTLN